MNALVLTAALSLLLVWGGREIDISGECAAKWCENGRVNAYTKAHGQAMLADQVAALTAGRDCTTSPRLSRTLLVLNAPKDRTGNIQFDTAVVREVLWDQGFASAQAGAVWILRYCG